MNYYQTTFALTPVLAEGAINNILQECITLLGKENARIIQQTEPKLQKLAYPIQKQQSGIYVNIEFEGPSTVVAKLETYYKRNEQMLRFLTTKLDKHGIAYKDNLRKGGKSVTQETKQAEVEKQPNKKTEQFQEKRKMYCRFKKFGINYIDYLNPNFLMSFLNPQGKILPRRYTGTSAKYQRKVSQAIKRLRILGLLPFVTDNLK